jgi:hypothetical protein
MLDRPTSLAAVILHRALSVAMAVLMLLSVAAAIEAGASTVPDPVGLAGAVLSSGDRTGAPIQPDSLPCHAAHHLCGKVAPLPPTLALAAAAIIHPGTSLDWASPRTLVSGLTELPPRPPRA